MRKFDRRFGEFVLSITSPGSMPGGFDFWTCLLIFL